MHLNVGVSSFKGVGMNGIIAMFLETVKLTSVLLHKLLYQCTPQTSAKMLRNTTTTTDSFMVHFFLSESSLSIENLSEVMEGIEGDWTKVWGHTGIGMAVSSIEDEINTSDKKKIAETCAAFYIKYDPDASWKNVAEGLSKQGEKAVLEKVQKYLKK